MLLNAKLKFNLRNGLSRPTQHHQIIPDEELLKINAYLQRNDPISLRFRVWYLLAIHFVTRGIEFHHQLSPSSLKFESDQRGHEYVTISHETHQKNHQGGLTEVSAETVDKRMYETRESDCPVKAVTHFLAKTDPSAKSLFNQCSKDALKNPDIHSLWYTATPCKVKQFSSFMPEIVVRMQVSPVTQVTPYARQRLQP